LLEGLLLGIDTLCINDLNASYHRIKPHLHCKPKQGDGKALHRNVLNTVSMLFGRDPDHMSLLLLIRTSLDFVAHTKPTFRHNNTKKAPNC
jgi:hypothetical protein